MSRYELSGTNGQAPAAVPMAPHISMPSQAAQNTTAPPSQTPFTRRHSQAVIAPKIAARAMRSHRSAPTVARSFSLREPQRRLVSWREDYVDITSALARLPVATRSGASPSDASGADRGEGEDLFNLHRMPG